MNFVGIDMSKDSFHVAFDEHRSAVFRNDPVGISDFLTALDDAGYERNDVTVGVESTGAYHLLFAEMLRRQKWPLKIINPLIASRVIKASLHPVKTDRTDARAIRTCLIAGHGNPYTDTPEILALKTLVQERQALCQMRTMLKQRLHAHATKALAVPFGLHNSFRSTLNAMTREISYLERKMMVYSTPTQKLLMSIPGIGRTNAAALVAYIGDIDRFSDPKKLTAYLGLDCRVHESGSSVHGKGYISKRGNSYLRSLLFNATFIARRRNPTLKAYYEKKRNEGKHYFSALCATERKLVHLIYGVWKRGTPFEANPPRDQKVRLTPDCVDNCA